MGKVLATTKGCRACHSVDGSRGIGPSWQHLFGQLETLEDGSQVLVDAAFIRESILRPNAKIAQGFAAIMPAMAMSQREVNALLSYIESLANPPKGK